MVNSLEDVDHLFSIKRTYIEEHENSEYVGWVKSEIIGFEIEDDRFRINLEHPWGEELYYSYDVEGLYDSNLKYWAEAFEYDIEDYKRMKYQKVWLVVKEIDVIDGEVESSTKAVHDKLGRGPYKKNNVKSTSKQKSNSYDFINMPVVISSIIVFILFLAVVVL